MLLAAAWVLSAFVSASPSPYSAARAFLVAVAAAAVLTVIGRLLLRSWERGALLATAVVLLLTQGRDASTIAGNIVRALAGWQTATLAILLVVALGASTYLLRSSWRRPGLSGRLGAYLNLFAALLCALLVASGLSRGSFDLQDLRQGVSLSNISRTAAQRAGPDIYLIILDGYPRADTLLESYGFDDAPFLDALRARGFWVDPASHTNYSITELVFTSLFHMSLLQDIPELQPVLDGEIPAQPTARRVLNENPAFSYLRSKGYTIVANSIPFASPALRGADVYEELGGTNELERHLIAASFLLDLTDLVNPAALADDLRAQVRAELAEIPRVAEDRDLGPRFVLAHVLAPHTPFLFDADGNPITSGQGHRHEDRVAPDDLTAEEFGALEVGEIQYLNGAALNAIDELIAASATPPVIVLTADEGVRAGPIDPTTITPSGIRDVFGTLFAAYTPGRTDIFERGTVSSQIMARLLNAYFDAGLPLASTETFVGQGSDPYHLTQVPEPLPPNS